MTETRRLRALIERLILRMRSTGPRFRGESRDAMEVVYASIVDDWADELEAALSEPPDNGCRIPACPTCREEQDRLSEPQAADTSQDDLRDAIIDYRSEVERLKKIGLNQYGEPQAAQEPTICAICQGRGWVMKSSYQDLGNGIASGGSWNEPCPHCSSVLPAPPEADKWTPFAPAETDRSTTNSGDIGGPEPKP